MNYSLTDSEVVFNRYYRLKSGLIADLGKDLSYIRKINKTFLIIAELRDYENADLNVIPAKIISIPFLETATSYYINSIVLEEVIV